MSGNKEEAGERREREREAEKIAGAVPPFRHTSRCLRLSLPRCFSLFHFRPCLPVAEILRRSKVEASTFTLARRHAAGIYDAPFIGKRSFHSRGLRVWLFGRVNVARMSSSIFRLSLSLSLSFSVPYAVAPPPRFSSWGMRKDRQNHGRDAPRCSPNGSMSLRAGYFTEWRPLNTRIGSWGFENYVGKCESYICIKCIKPSTSVI